MLRELLYSLRQLLGSWWKVDRIRIPTSTGRLFQLAPGDRLLIGGRLLAVRRRSLLAPSVNADGDPIEARGVEYCLDCLGDNTDGSEAVGARRMVLSATDQWSLQILLPSVGQPPCHRLWTGEAVEELVDGDVVVLRSRQGEAGIKRLISER